MRHFIEQKTCINEREENIGVEKTSCHVDMRGEAEFDDMGMEVMNEGQVV